MRRHLGSHSADELDETAPAPVMVRPRDATAVFAALLAEWEEALAALELALDGDAHELPSARGGGR